MADFVHFFCELNYFTNYTIYGHAIWFWDVYDNMIRSADLLYLI